MANSVDASGIVGTVSGPTLVDEIQTQIHNTHLELDLTRTKYIGSAFFTGTDENITGAHAGFMIDVDNAGDVTVTIPANSAVPIPVNTRIDLCQSGAGYINMAIGGTDTLLGPTQSRGQYQGLSLWKKSTTVWVVFGGQEPA